jgi:citronellol/citronellal dehydrogenase
MADTPLSGQVAFVTGTTRGIGKELALSLAEAGAKVVSTGKTTEPRDDLPGTIYETRDEIRDAGGESIAIELDVRDPENVESAIDRTVEEWGRLDIVINNAGAIHFAPIADTPAKRFDLLMDVNARGAYVTTRAALPHLREGDGGHAIMMSPPVAMDSAPGKAPYAFSKHGMTFIAKSLAAEETNVGVNALWPVTAIESEATRHFNMGTPDDWRTPAVVCDATLEILTSDPTECTGNAFYDEELLAEAGVEDFSEYAVVEGSDPGPTSAQLFDPDFERPDEW